MLVLGKTRSNGQHTEAQAWLPVLEPVQVANATASINLLEDHGVLLSNTIRNCIFLALVVNEVALLHAEHKPHAPAATASRTEPASAPSGEAVCNATDAWPRTNADV